MCQRIGLIDVGGGFRGIYAAGVLDYCMEQGIRFDVGIGVSAGSANVVSYAAQGKALIVAPDDTCGVNTLTREREPLLQLYQKGLMDAAQIQTFIGSE